MKTGKYVSLGHYENVKIGYGTIDCKDLKTIYIKFNAWLSPDHVDNYNQIIFNTRRNIKNYFSSIDDDLFKKETIVDLDIRTKGIKIDKRSFMDLEITLFTKDFFKMKEIKDKVYGISENIIKNTLTNKNLFNFHKKKEKT